MDTSENGLPIQPYTLYSIGGGQPENLLDFVNILQEELLRTGLRKFAECYKAYYKPQR